MASFLIAMLLCVPAVSAQDTTPGQLTPVWSKKVKPEQQQILAELVANMVYVPGGEFVMGSSVLDEEAQADEKPEHKVTLSDYHIGKFEVTQREWKAVMGRNPSYFKGDSLPVENISFDDCVRFVRKLNELTGIKFRLPTEAEWEYAARGAGSPRNYRYSGSNNVVKVAWFEPNSGQHTHAVGTKVPNELGLHDMAGNVWEWCYDWYDGTTYATSAKTNPCGPKTPDVPAQTMTRVVRGGGWYASPFNCRSTFRGVSVPTGTGNDLGLRLAVGDGVVPMGYW